MIAGAQHMQPHPECRHHYGILTRCIGVSHVSPIYKVSSSGAHHFEIAISFNQHSRVLIDANAQQPWILSHRAQQTAHAPTLGEMLVNDQSPNQAKARSQAKRSPHLR